ncbi:MAG TPA: ATP-dependent DNA helicase RecG, partial [Solirubrobacterales bacterium]|nr:ATP-dependent DNA helicase RecG [Solirubrobacterales bacterium]
MAAGRPVTAAADLAWPRFGGGATVGRRELLAAPVRWPRPSRLRVPVRTLRGVGARTEEALSAELGLSELVDLLAHLPREFRQPPPEVSIADLVEGEDASVVARVKGFELRRGAFGARRGSRVIARLTEITDPAASPSDPAVPQPGNELRAIWFNQPWVAEELSAGLVLRLSGTPGPHGLVVDTHRVLSRTSAKSMNEPDPAGTVALPLSRAGEWPVPDAIHAAPPVPVHPASERVPARTVRRVAWQALSRVDDLLEPLPVALRRRHGFPGVADATRAAHFPATAGSPEAATSQSEASIAPPTAEAGAALGRTRLAYEELLLHQVVLRRRRRSRRNARASLAAGAPGQLIEAWLAGLPFEPTADQAAAMLAIGADLESNSPMQRLLMGEVGSGKTVVALHAILRVIEHGGQAALLAPTEILAVQHADTVRSLLADQPVRFAALTGSTPAGERDRTLAGLAGGEIQLAIGTHALLEPRVKFGCLALSVVDEQHRFGVRQRAALDSKAPAGTAAHLLQMSATPIPRTAALAGHGDLDLTELHELPPRRRPVTTRLVPTARRAEEFSRLREQLDRGRQAFIVCPLIEASETERAKATLDEAERLRAGELAGYRVAVVHGRMPAAEKRATMEAFAAAESAVLVATTVVEVGVDVPNANTIVIEGAERFGLA